jgi:dynein heavy chain
MKDEWKHVKFELAEYRNSATHVLKGAEPIWDLLDEHIMKTMTIASSPYIKFLSNEVNFWKNTLIKV